MTGSRNEIFPTATCGYLAETGSWSIDTGLPGDSSPAALNNYARKMIQSFMEAFRGFCHVRNMKFDLFCLGDDGRPRANIEGEFIEVAAGDDQVLQDLDRIISRDSSCYFTRIVLSCDIRVSIPTAAGTLNQVWVPDAAKFYFAYVLEYEDAERLVPVDSSASFQTDIDVWVEKTIDPVSLQFRSNYLIAHANAPFLEDALKKWELLVGRPITDITSSYYRDQIFQYGFKSVVGEEEQ